MSSFIRNKTINLICENGYQYFQGYDANTAQHALGLPGSTLAAATVINMILPPCTTQSRSIFSLASILKLLIDVLPPSPDTPPINRGVTTIVMCIELVLALLVASSCVIFSVYFIVTRPPEGSVPTSIATAGGKEAEATAEDELKESLLEHDDDQEYGSFASENRSSDVQGAIANFFASIRPW